MRDGSAKGAAGREKSLPARRGVRPQGEGGAGAYPGRGRGGGKEECPPGGMPARHLQVVGRGVLRVGLPEDVSPSQLGR